MTFHPITNDNKKSKMIFKEILIALRRLNDIKIIFTAPNSDTGSIELKKMIINYVKKNQNSIFILNLGSLMYLSILKHVDLVLGNSSSGFTEAPYFMTPTLNISNRQDGRIKSSSITDTESKNKLIFG